MAVSADESSIRNLIGLIYEAVFDRTQMVAVARKLRDDFGGSRACIVRTDRFGSSAIATEDDPGLLCPEAQNALVRDPLWSTAQAMPLGKVYHRRKIIDEQRFRTRELWTDWFRPRDMGDGMASTLIHDQDSFWSIDLQRSERQQPFDREDAELLAEVVPHFIRASQLARQISDGAAAAGVMALPHAALLLNSQGQLLAANARAEDLLADGVIARAADKTIHLPGHPAQRDFEGRVAACCAMPLGDARVAQASIMLRAGSGARFALSIAPFTAGEHYGLARNGSAIVLILPLSAHDGALVQNLRTLFRLAPAEARLAAALATGRSLVDAAAGLGIAHSTARFYLEQIFRKTDTHHQGELVALLSRLAAMDNGR